MYMIAVWGELGNTPIGLIVSLSFVESVRQPFGPGGPMPPVTPSPQAWRKQTEPAGHVPPLAVRVSAGALKGGEPSVSVVSLEKAAFGLSMTLKIDPPIGSPAALPSMPRVTVSVPRPLRGCGPKWPSRLQYAPYSGSV